MRRNLKKDDSSPPTFMLVHSSYHGPRDGSQEYAINIKLSHLNFD